MGLLERYELMKQAELEAEKAKLVEEQANEISDEETKIASERMEVLAKYAEFADEALKAEYGDDYDYSDVEKLAEMLIANDLQIEEEEEKVAELVEAGQIMAQSFAEELNKIANATEQE
jgi:hypothetical protein